MFRTPLAGGLWDPLAMNATPFTPGERLVWRHQPRGGYGYVWPVDVTVVRRGPKRVLVEAPLARGGAKRVWVSPDALRRVTP